MKRSENKQITYEKRIISNNYTNNRIKNEKTRNLFQ